MSLFGLSTRRKIALARLAKTAVQAGRKLSGQPMQAIFTRNQLRWELDLNEGIDFAIYLFGSFEPELVKCYTKIIQPGATVFDLGANIGAHTIPLARQVGPAGRVIAVEATAYAFAKLSRNLALNPELIPRTTTVHGMLLPNDNESALPTALHSSWPLTAADNIHPTLGGALKPLGDARKVMLDKLVSELEITRVDYIKLDVDGNELTVLQGARSTLTLFKPKIFMELAPYCFSDLPGGFAALVELLTSIGYRFQDLSSGRSLPTAAGSLEAIIPRNGSINVLAST